MVTISKQPSHASVNLGKHRNYQEIIEFLDKQWSVNRTTKTLDRIKQLDAALASPSKAVNTILVAGTNGKSLTLHFTAKLLREEGLTVGTYYAPHMLTYNERIAVNHESIVNKTFTDIANDVINTAQSLGIEANSSEILLMIALIHFKQTNVDVALIEVSNGGQWNPAALCHPKIAAITRVIQEDPALLESAIKEITNIAQKDTFVVSADQSKLNLQIMADKAKENQATWVMPIRKLAALSYPMEQLHGRCAALAERIAQLYVEKFAAKHATVVADSLLIKPKGQRGRPTLEAKKHLELNPKRTIEQFWKEEISSLPGRFQLLDKEKPTVLLDNASNIDAFKNLFLGIRLLHYQRPLKGLTIIVGAHKDTIHTQEFLKLVRYFFKKTSGSLIFFPVEDLVPGVVENKVWDVEKITNEIKNLKIKARATKSFKEAFDLAKKNVDERHGLIVVTGSSAAINEYWNYKGIKKL
jgi:dihydrofolate synthase/folylpolyglutamate synthase